MTRLSAREIDSVRQVVTPENARASDAHLQSLVDETLLLLPADASEDFLKSLGSVAKAAVPVLEKAAPVVLKGVASVAAPYTSILGAGVNLASGLISPSKAPSPPAAQAAASAPKPTTTDTPPPASPNPFAELPQGQVAAAIVLGLMQNTMIQQALLSQVLGQQGRSTFIAPSG